MGVSNPELEASFAKELSEIESKLSSMSTEELQRRYREAEIRAATYTKFAEDEVGGLGALASKEGPSLDQKEAEEDERLTRGSYWRRAALYEGELQSRGLTLTRPGTLMEAPVWAETRAQALDPSMDTGHYDDGHALGWNSSPAPAPDASDTGHYDDGHAFGWKQPEPEAPPYDESETPKELPPDHGLFIDGMGALASPPPKPAPKTASAIPKPVVGAGAALLVLVAGVGFALTRSATVASDATSAPTATRSIRARS